MRDLPNPYDLRIEKWLILRRFASWANSWAKAAVLGWAIGGALWSLCIWLLYDNGKGDIEAMGRYINIGWVLIAGIAGGLGIGLGQWLILCQRLTGWWFVLTTLSWAILWALAFVLSSVRLITTERVTLDDSELF